MFLIMHILLFSSIVAQIPEIPEPIVGFSRGLWMLLFMVLFLFNRKRLFQIRYFTFFFCSLAALLVYIAACSLFSTLYLHSPAFHLVFPAFIAYAIGCCMPETLSEDEVRNLMVLYFIYAGLLVVVLISRQFSSLYDFIGSYEYWYKSKNSIARIIGAGALLFLFTRFEKKRNLRLARVLGVLFFRILFVLRSRAALLGIVTALIYHMFRKRQYMRIALSLTVAVVWMSSVFRNFEEKRYDDLEVEQAFVIRSMNLDRYDDINRFSGGRVDLFNQTIEVIKENFLVGVGVCDWPVDNFYLNITAQLGFLGLLLFMGFVLYRLLLNMKFRVAQFPDNGLMHCLELITVMNFMVSFFEGGGFLGPGNVMISLWLLSGYFDARATMGRLSERPADKVLTYDERPVAG